MPLTVNKLLLHATNQLKAVSTSAESDALCLLESIYPNLRSQRHLWPELSLNETQHQQWQALLNQRLQGTPVAYILGYCYFWDLKLNVTPHTLIPRRETEHLVETLFAQTKHCNALTLADAGTGCGTIACTVAKHRPQWEVIGLELCPHALKVAQTNATDTPNLTFCVQTSLMLGPST